jgi:hypothetical protein
MTTALTITSGGLGQDVMAEDREILEAYAEVVRSRPSGAADANLVPDESEGSNPDG